MIIYLLIIFVILLFGKKINKKEYSYADFIVLLLLILVAGLRYNTGTDYAMYNVMYFNPDAQNAEKVEFGYKLLMQGAYNIFQENSYLFFLLCSAITIILIYIIIKKYSKKPGESLFYFVTLGFYTLSFNMVRQSLAMAITFFALKYLFNRNCIKYILTVLIASCFHMTALIMIPLYWLSNIEIKTKKLFIIMIILCFSGVLFNPIFNYITSTIPQYSMYASYEEAEVGIGTYIVNIIYILLIVITIMFRKKLISNDKNYKFIINTVTFSTFFIILSLQNTLFARMIYYWFMPIVLILPEYVRFFKEENRNIIQFVIIACFILFYVLNIYSFNGVYPYSSILQL